MLVIGLTGGLGSGKSLVADYFSALSVPIMDTDNTARALVAPGQPSLKKIIAHYGNDFLNADGTLNRKKLHTVVFTDEQERQWLENLLHPQIRQQMQAYCDQQRASAQSTYVILVIPLLVETLPNPLIDRILLVDCPKELQIKRVMVRDPSLSEAMVEAVIGAQASREARLAQANDVIANDGSLEQLKHHVKALHERYLTLST